LRPGHVPPVVADGDRRQGEGGLAFLQFIESVPGNSAEAILNDGKTFQIFAVLVFVGKLGQDASLKREHRQISDLGLLGLIRASGDRPAVEAGARPRGPRSLPSLLDRESVWME
jgi:hypothetical protein